MLSVKFKPKRTAVATCSFLATARLSCVKHRMKNSDLKSRTSNAEQFYIEVAETVMGVKHLS